MNSEELKSSIAKSLNHIRTVLDADVTECDISTVENKGLQLTQLSGLASECKAQAKKLLGLKQLEVLSKYHDSKLSPSILSKTLDAECYDEEALLVYADRVNASISHNLDFLRSVISKYKTEIEQSLRQ